jgi:hypothetical protein
MAYAEAVIQKGYVRGLCAHIPCSLNKKHAAHMDMGGMEYWTRETSGPTFTLWK